MKARIWIVAALTFFSAGALADSPPLPSKRRWFFLGGEAGLMNKSQVTSPEVEASGRQFGLKAGYSHYTPQWIFDGALGWRKDRLSGDTLDIDTKAFLGETAARYRLSQNWSIGPVLSLLAGDDVSFSDIGTNSDDKPVAVFAGARLFYEIPVNQESNFLRLGLQAQTDVDISKRQVSWAQVLIEFGWPFSSRSYSYHPINEPQRLELNLMNAGVRFATGQAELLDSSKEIIERLAKVLAKYKQEWTNVAVLGHTDVTGDYRSNVKLSMARAETVAEELTKQAINSKKLMVAGFGPEKPLDPAKNPAAYAKNRRVEVQITAANPSRSFQKELEAALKTAATKN